MNLHLLGQFLDVTLNSENVLFSYDNDHKNCIILLERNKYMKLVPIVDDIIIWLEPLKIIDIEQINKINNLFSKMLGKPSVTSNDRIIKKYLENLNNKSKNNTLCKELLHYEKRYKGQYYSLNNEYCRSGDYLLSFKNDILQHLNPYTNTNQSILELSGGDFYTLRKYYPKIAKDNIFIGTEISFWGLKCGKVFLNEGIFIQLDIEDDMPFKEESFDILLIKGVLHHTNKKNSLIPILTKYITKKGFLGIHEVIYEKSTIPLSNIYKALKSSKKKTSPMNEFLDKIGFFDNLNAYFDCVVASERGSVFRMVANIIFSKLKTKSEFLSNFIFRIDSMINKIPIIKKIWLTNTHIVNFVGQKR